MVVRERRIIRRPGRFQLTLTPEDEIRRQNQAQRRRESRERESSLEREQVREAARLRARTTDQQQRGINHTRVIQRADGQYTPIELQHNRMIEEINSDDEEAYQRILEHEDHIDNEQNLAEAQQHITPPEDYAAEHQQAEQKRTIRRNYNTYLRRRKRQEIALACKMTIDEVHMLEHFDSNSFLPYKYFGTPTGICKHCKAFFWLNEATSNGEYNKCCHKGAVVLPPIPEPPLYLKNMLLCNEMPGSINKTQLNLFKEKVRIYNSRLSCASISMDKDRFISGSHGIPTLRIHGSVYHNIGSLLFNQALYSAETKASFLQILFHETAFSTEHYNLCDSGKQMLTDLHLSIRHINTLYNTFKAHVNENLPILETVDPTFTIRFKTDIDQRIAHPRTVNAPTIASNSWDVAAIVMPPTDNGDKPKQTNRDIVVFSKDTGHPQRIKYQHAAYDTLAYGLTHCHGTNGWHLNVPRYKWTTNDAGVFTYCGITGKTVTAMEFYGYRGHFRESKIPVPILNPQNEAILRYEIPDPNIMTDTLLYGGKLAQQYWTDMYVKVEQSRLDFILFNQQKIRAELYQGLLDAIDHHDEANAGVPVEKSVILPSTFLGGHRHQHQCYQDAMSMVRRHGKPDFFITFTCNPKWPEIANCLRPNEEAWMRPDIVTRVFKMKVDELLADLMHGNIFGKHVAHTAVIEFQKRGLPHIHILLIVDSDNKPRTSDDYDKIVYAELPDEEANPRLYQSVKSHMVHGPCGDANPECPCMVNGQCSKGFPKEYSDFTVDGNDTYPTYRRRKHANENGEPRGFTKVVKNSEVLVSNIWIAPYNPYLLLKYDAHINVEICNSISAVKYLYKYVYKGPDTAVINISADSTTNNNGAVNNNNAAVAAAAAPLLQQQELGNQQQHPRAAVNEITRYQSGRYLGPCEAMWRMFGYEMSDRYPSVMRLQVHLPNMQTITFIPGLGNEAIAAAKPTMLEAFFTQNLFESNVPLNAQQRGVNPKTKELYPTANELTYCDFPSYYTWQTDSHTWQRRKKVKYSDIIARMYSAHPMAGERFYLRMLLHKVKGPTSFDHLRTVDGVLMDTFKDACGALGLLADDNEWKQCLIEAYTMTISAHQLRQLFVHILFHNLPINPNELWHTLDVLDHSNDMVVEGVLPPSLLLKHALASDIAYQMHQINPGLHPETTANDSDIQQSLYLIDDLLCDISSGSKSLKDYFLPIPMEARRELIHQQAQNPISKAMRKELNYNREVMTNAYKAAYTSMNVDQKKVFDDIIYSYTQKQHKIFFIDAPGGTGKTFVENAILARVRSSETNNIAISTASSGISAILLTGGRTAHSRFKIPINCRQGSQSSMSRRRNDPSSEDADVIRQASIIIWDEFPMSHRNTINCVDRLLRDLMKDFDPLNAHLPFGGKLMCFSGDWRQTLPVEPHGGRGETIQACAFELSWWEDVKLLHLHINERVRRGGQTAHTEAFGDFLLQLGNGDPALINPLLGEDHIVIPEQYRFPSPLISDLIKWCYPGIDTAEFNLADIDASILTPLNKDVDDINSKAVALMTAQQVQGNNPLIEIPSVDTICEDSEDAATDAINFPTEYLNSITLSGMPPHLLQLKIGVPIICLRNLDTSKGVCNGTRLKVLSISNRLIRAQILSGSHKGETYLIPRTDLISDGSSFPVRFKRRQFPTKLAFAMTINKSQGQSLAKVGIYLPRPVFCHGQLYVALSRSGNPEMTKILAPDVVGQQGQLLLPDHEEVCTKNIVYREALGRAAGHL